MKLLVDVLAKRAAKTKSIARRWIGSGLVKVNGEVKYGPACVTSGDTVQIGKQISFVVGDNPSAE